MKKPTCKTVISQVDQGNVATLLLPPSDMEGTSWAMAETLFGYGGVAVQSQSC